MPDVSARFFFAVPPPPLRNRAVALLLTGHAFRTGGRTGGQACNFSKVVVAGQHNATLSHISSLIRPLEAHGAQVHVLCVINRCSQPQVNRSLEVGQHFVSWYREAAKIPPDRIRTTVVDSPTFGDGIKGAYAFLRHTEAARRLPFDYVLQVRHDIALERPISEWPANFSKLLFEQQCVDCDNSCMCCGREDTIKLRKRADCDICAADHLLWAPARFVPLLHRAIVGRATVGHGLIQDVLKHEAAKARDQKRGHARWLDPQHEVGFMFPHQDACRTREEGGSNFFPMDLPCTELAAYRPLRVDPDSGKLVASIVGSVAWATWQREHAHASGQRAWRERVAREAAAQGLDLDWWRDGSQVNATQVNATRAQCELDGDDVSSRCTFPDDE